VTDICKHSSLLRCGKN